MIWSPSFVMSKASVPLEAVAAETSQAPSVDETAMASAAATSAFATQPASASAATAAMAVVVRVLATMRGAVIGLLAESGSDDGDVWTTGSAAGAACGPVGAQVANEDEGHDRDVDDPRDDLQPRHLGREADGGLQDRGERTAGSDDRR